MNAHNKAALTSNRNDRIRLGKALGSACLAMFLLVIPAEARNHWSDQGYAELFPAAGDGWSVGDVKVEELKTLTSGFEGTVSGLTGSGLGASVRLRLTRFYTAGGKRIEFSIDTQNIDLASILRAAHENTQVRDQFAQQGYRTRMFGTRRAMAIETGGKNSVLIGIGRVGVIAAGCSYAKCAEDLERTMASANLDELDRFADYDHRKQ